MADIVTIVKQRHPDIEITRHEGRHLRAQCPKCAERGNDTSKDNLVITPDKGIAKCFACGYVIGTSASLEKKHRCIYLLHQNEPAKEYLRSRKVLEAALESEVVGWTDEEIAKEVGMQGLVFFCKQGYNVRSIVEKKFRRSPNVKAGPFEIHTGASEWMVCEGEIDALTLFAIFGEHFNYAAMGGTSNFDKIHYPEPFYVVPDNDDASKEALEKIKNKNYFVIYPPAPYKDVNEAFVKEPDLTKDHLIKQALRPEKHLKPLDAIIEQVEALMASKGNSRIKKRQVAELILRELELRGEFIYHHGLLYYFDKTTSQLVVVSSKNNNWASIISAFGIYSSEQIYGFLNDTISAEMIYKGRAKRKPIHTSSFFDPERYALYLDLGGGQILEVTEDKKRLVPQGEMIFYTSSMRNLEIIDADKDYFWEMLGNYTIKDENHRKMLYSWVIATLFTSLFETKPILIIESVAGSGKTSLAKLIGRILVGPEFDVTSLSDSVDSFMAVVSRNPIVVFDNAEKISKEVLDYIAMASTGATFQKRRLYHEFEIVSAPSRAWMIFTMMNNTLRRKDIIERSIIIQMERISSFKPARSLYDSMTLKLARGSIINVCQQVIKVLRTKGFESDKEAIRKIRMADFAVFLDVVCEVKGWDSEELAKWWLKSTAVEALQDNLYNMAFLQAIDNLKAWGQMLTAKQVLDEMKSLPFKSKESGGMEVSHKDRERLQSMRPKGFWRWLEQQKDNFSQLGYVITIYTHGTWRHKTFSIIKTEDAIDPEQFEFGEVEDDSITEAPF